MSKRNRFLVAVCAGVLGVSVVTMRAGIGAAPGVAVSAALADAGDLQSQIVGSWAGVNVYPHVAGTFAQTDLAVTFTHYGTFVLTRGPIAGRPVRDRFSGEYRVFGSGIVLSVTELGYPIVLHDVSVTTHDLGFTASVAASDGVLNGGGTLQRQW